MSKTGTRERPIGVRAWRERAGLSRMELVRRLSIPLDPTSLYNLETGRSKSTAVENAIAIADALSEALGEEVTVYDLFPRKISGRKGFAPTFGLESQDAGAAIPAA